MSQWPVGKVLVLKMVLSAVGGTFPRGGHAGVGGRHTGKVSLGHWGQDPEKDCRSPGSFQLPGQEVRVSAPLHMPAMMG